MILVLLSICGRARRESPAPATNSLAQEAITILARADDCLVAAFLSAAFFLLALRIVGKARPAVLAWAVFSFTSPLVYFSQLIYPEIPVSLVALLIFLFVVLENDRDRRPYGCGAWDSVLPWFELDASRRSCSPSAFRPAARGGGGARLSLSSFRPRRALPVLVLTLYGKPRRRRPAGILSSPTISSRRRPPRL
jgi:hypothetical protein